MRLEVIKKLKASLSSQGLLISQEGKQVNLGHNYGVEERCGWCEIGYDYIFGGATKIGCWSIELTTDSCSPREELLYKVIK
ncbi:hypothetical protein SUGI_1169210 [Cryptomeria japonica]|nr:hypothetical protein SUGI_1169210 [Cryptomeria japonica]